MIASLQPALMEDVGADLDGESQGKGSVGNDE
jgi:hypothetical protein